MKCVVTGHTSGVGKAIYDHLLTKGWDVRGMSRSNSYDIVHNQDRVIADSIGCDLFVNCAYSGNAQLELLELLNTKVKNMIVVGSVSADWANVWKEYGSNKHSLEKRCKELSMEYDKSIANIFYLKLAFCENASWPEHLDSDYKATFDDITKVIDIWLSIPKIYSVEFTLKKTPEIMEYAKRMNPHD
jgi:NADP-dependent 3-hydroxy acid dehydrogenase YdfG